MRDNCFGEYFAQLLFSINSKMRDQPSKSHHQWWLYVPEQDFAGSSSCLTGLMYDQGHCSWPEIRLRRKSLKKLELHMA